MMKRSGKKTLSIIVVMAMICTLSIMSVDFAADLGGESIVTPTMDVWFEQNGDTVIAEYSLMADTTGGTFSANFTGVCDIHPLSTGLIVQPDGLGNQTVTNWWAPNPELMVNPMLETINGYGWLDTVTVVFDEGTPTETAFEIPVDPEFGSFENVDLGVDFYGGLTFRAYDGMTSRMMTVSALTIEWMDINSDKVMMVAEPSAYIQFVIIEGTLPDVSFPVWVDGSTDETGHLLFDFSTTSDTPYDLTMESWGFTRNYDGHNNATLYEWRASDYPLVFGDLSGDGLLDKADVKLLAKAIATKIELSGYQKIVADVDQDGDVDALDLKALNQLIKQK